MYTYVFLLYLICVSGSVFAVEYVVGKAFELCLNASVGEVFLYEVEYSLVT